MTHHRRPQTSRVRMLQFLVTWIGLAGAGNVLNGIAAEPVALRIDSLLVTPAHTPSAVVHVKNLADSPYHGTIRLHAPAGWALKTDEQPISLLPAETSQFSFMIQRGTTIEKNSYSLEALATGRDATVIQRQKVVVASAPYFKPKIDGNLGDWNDAIPVSWNFGGKSTTISTYWNRKQFALLIAVEEDRLIPATVPSGEEYFDAVQIAISAQGTSTGNTPDAKASRYEFLIVPTAAADGCCYLLASPAISSAATQSVRALDPLRYHDAEVAVRRNGPTTYYECSIPWKLMQGDIPAGEGREFCLSLLVHDPDGTGVRDWGEAAGLWPWQRNRLAWSQWPGARWGELPPFDNKTPWGMCSSKY